MKPVLLILILCVACAQPSLPKKVSDREHDGFLGPVKVVSVTWSPVSGYGQIPANARCRQMTNVYDQSGRLMQHSVYPGSCGVDETREDYTYAPDGSRTTKSHQTRGEDSLSPPAAARENDRGGNVGLRTVFKYDAAGKLTEAASVKLGGDIPYKYMRIRSRQ